MSPRRHELRPRPRTPADTTSATNPAATGPEAGLTTEPETRNPRSFRWLRLLAIVGAVAGLAVLGLHGRLPDPRAFVGALADAEYGWILVAALLQAASLAAFAFQQRRLLDNLGVRLRHGHAIAVTLARTALAISLPAGAAVSTGYAIREYQRAGATREIAAASAIVSGLASIGGLTLLYVGGALTVVTQDPGAFLSWQPLAVVLALAAVTTAAVVIGRRQMRGNPADRSGRAFRSEGRLVRYLRNLLTSARDAWRAGAALRTRDWAVALTYAAVNWLTDLLCLVAATRALGLPVGVTTLAGIYLGVQIVRQVPLTPGGVGVIETALVAGLTASGATAVAAAAAVLIYRLLSCWLIIPAGGIAALVLRRDVEPQPAP
jgi:uncharacterized protein (TIRG00374 family)